MRTGIPLLAIALVASACGSIQTTTAVRDDVYDIPERTPVMAAATPVDEPLPGLVDDYYDPNDPGKYNVGYPNERSYNDITYNDPQWYNYGRFTFGTGVSSWGPSYGMGMNYGAPGFNGGNFGNPYWGNSYMSGFGAWGNPYGSIYGSSMGMYGSNYGYGNGYYDPYGGFYNPYGGSYFNPYGGCFSCGGYGGGGYYGGAGYYGSGAVIQHRPSLSGGGSTAGSTGLVAPPQYRPNSLLSRPNASNPSTRNADGRVQQRQHNSGGLNRSPNTTRQTQGSRNGGEMNRSTGGSSGGSGGSGSGGGGGSRPSTGGGGRR